MSLLNYKYYDSPEGHDIFKKVFVTSKYAGLAGLGFATTDILMHSHPKGFVRTAGRFLFIVGPLVGMASAFTVTANVAQNIRGKNDKINYFLGGVTAGSIVGAVLKSPFLGVPAALVLGAIAVVKKTAIDEGWVFLPEIHMANKSIRSVRHDWTLVKDLDDMKTWTTGTK